MNVETEVKAIEADVKAEVSAVEAKVTEAIIDPVKASILAQKQNFLTQLDTVKKNMAKLQQDFEAQKTLGIRLEGALESLEMLLKSAVSK